MCCGVISSCKDSTYVLFITYYPAVEEQFSFNLNTCLYHSPEHQPLPCLERDPLRFSPSPECTLFNYGQQLQSTTIGLFQWRPKQKESSIVIHFYASVLELWERESIGSRPHLHDFFITVNSSFCSEGITAQEVLLSTSSGLRSLTEGSSHSYSASCDATGVDPMKCNSFVDRACVPICLG